MEPDARFAAKVSRRSGDDIPESALSFFMFQSGSLCVSRGVRADSDEYCDVRRAAVLR